MKIEFYRSKANQVILYLTRNDGSTTWSKLHPGIEAHDIAHYAVESVLNLKDSFFGLIERGAEISDFEDKEKQPFLPKEALFTEHLVNLLQTEGINQGKELDLIKLLQQVLDFELLEYLDLLNDQNMLEIRRVFNTEYSKLLSLPIGQRLHYSISDLSS